MFEQSLIRAILFRKAMRISWRSAPPQVRQRRKRPGPRGEFCFGDIHTAARHHQIRHGFRCMSVCRPGAGGRQAFQAWRQR